MGRKPTLTLEQTRFLDCVSKYRDVLLAAEKAHVPFETVEEWLKKEWFFGLVERNQGLFLARLEYKMLRMGSKKSMPTPFLACLNSHSAEYGAIKRVFLDKLLTQFVTGFVKEAKEIVPAPLLAQLSEILVRQAERTSKRVPD